MVGVHTRAKFKAERAAGAGGAFVTGIDLARALDADEVAGLRAALDEHLVAYLPDQTIALDDLERLTEQLGGRAVTPFVKPLADRPFVIRVLKEKHETLNFANAWHTDLSYLAEPPSYTILYCVEAPPHGGDTIWANQYMAYETLSAGLKESLRGLDAVHSAGMAYGTGMYLDQVKHKMSTAIEPSKDAFKEHAHPVATAHPATGKAALFVNPVYTTRIAEWSNAESQGLLQYLYRHATNENFTFRLRWKKGTLAIWDNRCTQHFAMNDYHGYRRDMLRTSVKGSAPARAAA